MPDDDTVTVVHVAAADENRGRVVLLLGAAEPNRIAVEASLRVARAYQASLESLSIEHQHLLDVATHEGAREISLCGRERRPLSVATFMRQFAYAARTAERRIAGMARLADIPYRARTLRDTPLHALNRACAESGPWNVVAFADPLQARDHATLSDLMQDTAEVTGFVLVAPQARRTHGPIVIVLEDADRLQQLLRIGERLRADADEPLLLLLVADTEAAADAMDQTVRIALEDRSDVTVRMAANAHGDPNALAEVLRRLAGGFVIGQAGRGLLPRHAPWLALAQTLECPLFIAR
jgi:hypothetical protein